MSNHKLTRNEPPKITQAEMWTVWWVSVYVQLAADPCVTLGRTTPKTGLWLITQFHTHIYTHSISSSNQDLTTKKANQGSLGTFSDDIIRLPQVTGAGPALAAVQGHISWSFPITDCSENSHLSNERPSRLCVCVCVCVHVPSPGSDINTSNLLR